MTIAGKKRSPAPPNTLTTQRYLGSRDYFPGGKRMSHTMREVAKRAGVSPATVSRVLNKTRYISVETERRVLEVVGQMKYFKNVHARRLATGRSDLFGLVISEIRQPVFPRNHSWIPSCRLGSGVRRPSLQHPVRPCPDEIHPAQADRK